MAAQTRWRSSPKVQTSNLVELFRPTAPFMRDILEAWFFHRVRRRSPKRTWCWSEELNQIETKRKFFLIFKTHLNLYLYILSEFLSLYQAKNTGGALFVPVDVGACSTSDVSYSVDNSSLLQFCSCVCIEAMPRFLPSSSSTNRNGELVHDGLTLWVPTIPCLKTTLIWWRSLL